LCERHERKGHETVKPGQHPSNKGYGTTRTITVRAAPRDPRRALLSFGGTVFPAALGRSGLTSLKREGDGATPRAAMRVLGGYVRGDRMPPPLCRLPLRRTLPDMGWCDAPGHPSYNRPVRLPFSAGHETMRRADRLYDVVIVLDWNMRCRKRGAGSAIFFHIAKPGYAPTEGCIAVAPATMRRILPFLSRQTVLRVV
jgi:L,D-peptidoglycan transpeptidase YkuD (ErfK/YbiS/YcfS/YnhG family)